MSDRANFPRINTACNHIASQHGNFYAECVELISQLIVGVTTMREIQKNAKASDEVLKQYFECQDETIKFFACRVSNHFNIPIPELTNHVKAISIGAVEDSFER